MNEWIDEYKADNLWLTGFSPSNSDANDVVQLAPFSLLPQPQQPAPLQPQPEPAAGVDEFGPKFQITCKFWFLVKFFVVAFLDFRPSSLLTRRSQKKFHGVQTWIMNSIKKWLRIYVLGVGNPVFGAPKIWNSSKFTKNLKFIDPNQQPNIHQNTIVSLPASQMAIAPSPNYLKYSKVWEKNPSRRENYKNKTIAQRLFLSIAFFFNQIKTDFAYLWVLEVLKGHQKTIKHITCQTNVKVRKLSSKVVRCVMRKHKLRYFSISVCWTNCIFREVQK